MQIREGKPVKVGVLLAPAFHFSVPAEVLKVGDGGFRAAETEAAHLAPQRYGRCVLQGLHGLLSLFLVYLGSEVDAFGQGLGVDKARVVGVRRFS